MELHMSDGTAVANGKTYTCTKLPEYMQGILNQGGLIASLNKEENITMGMTIAEKIIAAAAGVESVKPGDIHTVTA